MENKKLLFTVIILLISGCATTVPLSKTYYDSESRLGVIYLINDISMAKEGSQGLLDMALTPGSKYEQPLKIVDEEVNPIDKVKKMYTDIFTEKGKIITEITEIPIMTYPKFIKPKGSSGKKFYKFDLRAIKEHYEIDEILLVNVNYGIVVTYSGFIEVGKNGYCNIGSEIVNLKDNSLLHRNASMTRQKIMKGWNHPPKYESLQESIDRSIKQALTQEQEKLLFSQIN